MQFIKRLIGHKLFENFMSLLSIQGLNYILPLITLPYLIRVLGLEKFGVLLIVQVYISYLKVIVDYGFKLTAVDEVSKNIDDHHSVSKTFFLVIVAKILLFCFSVFVAFLILYCFSNTDKYLYYIALGSLEIIGAIIYVDWFFQGIQKMKLLAIMEFITKLLFTILIFVLVKDSGDLAWAILSQSIAYLVTGIIAVILAIRTYPVKFTLPNINELVTQLKDGFPVFLSQALVPLYTSLNIIFLGFYSNEYIVGVYGSAEKIFTALRSISKPFNRSIFPHLSSLFDKSKKSYNSFILKTLKIYSVIFIILGIIIYLLAPFIMNLIAGDELHPNSILVLRILCFALIFVPFGPFISQLLVIENKRIALLQTVMIVVLINLVVANIIIPAYQEIGLAFQVVLISFLVPLISYLFYNSSNNTKSFE